jgi:hypothetical protein
MCDATIDSPPGSELHKAARYAQRHNLPFPPIDESSVGNVCSVHASTDGTTPIVIYLPLIKNPGFSNGWDPRTADFTGTLQLSYTTQQIGLLAGLAQYNVAQSRELIVAAIKECVTHKNAIAKTFTLS